MRTSLEGCEKVWGYMGCKCKPTVGVGGYGVQAHLLWGLAARLDSVCPDGIDYDICNYVYSWYLSFVGYLNITIQIGLKYVGSKISF